MSMYLTINILIALLIIEKYLFLFVCQSETNKDKIIFKTAGLIMMKP